MPQQSEPSWAPVEDEAIRDLTHWTMRGGRDKRESRLEWITVAQILNESATAIKIKDARWYTQENVSNRYNNYIRRNSESKAEWEARTTAHRAALAMKKSNRLVGIAARDSEEYGRLYFQAATSARNAIEAQFEQEEAEEAAERAKMALEAEEAEKANPGQAAMKARDILAATEVEKTARDAEKAIHDAERAFEAAKVREADKKLEQELYIFEERVRREEAEDAARKAKRQKTSKVPASLLNHASTKTSKTVGKRKEVQPASEVIVLDDDTTKTPEKARKGKGRLSTSLAMILNDDERCYD